MTFLKLKKNTATEYHTIAFYNLENLFDTFDDKLTNDNDFLPKSERQWTQKRYRKKLNKLGKVISKIGAKTSGKTPVIVGLAEVENRLVVSELITSKSLRDKSLDLVHFDSPDNRGIDVALIYNTEYFKVENTEVFPLYLIDAFENRDHTRDILLVEGSLNNEKIYVLVNHWPSRREGLKISEPKRLTAAAKVIDIIDIIKAKDAAAKIIIMGDFNDNPLNKSIKKLTNSHDLFNPMEALLSYARGSLNYRFEWNLFDQILFTTNFFEFNPKGHRFSKANIFDNEFLKQFKGKYKGIPFRTYVGRKYKGGFSDHFPVYIHLKKTT